MILPHDHGLADIADYRDLEVIAVNMPNEPGVRNVDWNTYRTTVDAIEALTGYDLLALLPDDIESAVESNTQPPIAAIAGPAGALPKATRPTFSACGSIDPNGSVASYAWDFGDGATAAACRSTHTFAQDGAFTVRVTVTDNDGLTDSATFAIDGDQRGAGGRHGAERLAERRRHLHGGRARSRIPARTPGRRP